jgi:hypothetical protein
MARIRRIVILVAGVTGLLAATAGVAHAIMQNQHCEPIVGE